MENTEEIKLKIKKRLEKFKPKYGNIDTSSLASCDNSNLQSFYEIINSPNENGFKNLLDICNKYKLESIYWSLLTNYTYGPNYFNVSENNTQIQENKREELKETIEYLNNEYMNNKNIYEPLKEGNTLLHYAAKGSFIDAIKKTQIPLKIMKGIIAIALRDGKEKDIIRYKNYCQCTPLRRAINNEHYEAIEYLAECYNRFEIIRDKWSLVHLAAQINGEKFFPPLFRNGWNVDELDDEGRTLLLVTVEKGDIASIKYILDRNADLKANDKRGYTPLLVAASCDNFEAVKLLIQYNADNDCLRNEKDNDGKGILAIAIKHNSIKVFEFIINYSSTLLSYMVKEKILRDDSSTLFSYTVKRKTSGDNMNSSLHMPDSYQNTHLHIVAQTGNIEIFETLIKSNFYKEIDLLNKDEQTPLHIAAENGCEDIFRNLLSKGASLKVKDKNGETPFYIICKKGLTNLIQNVLNRVDSFVTNNSRRDYLEIAIKTQNLFLLKHVFEKFFNEQKDIILQDNQACFKRSIETGFEEGVRYFLNMENIETFLRRQPPTKRPFDCSSPNPKSPMQLLIEYMPKMAGIVFDQCITKENNETIFNFEFLDNIYYTPTNNKNMSLHKTDDKNDPEEAISLKNSLLSLSEEDMIYQNPDHMSSQNVEEKNYNIIMKNHPLTLIVKHNCHDLLFHTLVEAYIDIKWNRFAKWGYYASCLFLSLFLIVLTFVIIETKPISEINGNVTTNDTHSYYSESRTISEAILAIFVVIQFGILVFKIKQEETFNFFDTCGTFITLLISFIGITSMSITFRYWLTPNMKWNILIFLNLCAWLNIMNYLKKHPRFGVYVLMIQHIITSFLRFAPIFIVFLLPFVIFFHVSLVEDISFPTFFETFLHTLVMMTGEFNYKETIASKSNVLTSIVFCIFLFFITIFLMNFLIGLAVSDISKILEKITVTRRIMQIGTIHHVEISMPEYFRKKYWEGFCQHKINMQELERKKHYFTSAEFREYFKWFGLSKSTIKDQISNEGTPEYIILLEKRISELERKLDNSLARNNKLDASLAENNTKLISELNNISKNITALNQKFDDRTHVLPAQP